jgi:hypothetical protein
MDIKLGARVKDRVTGFTGVVTQRVENLNGCVQFTVRPPMDTDGKLGECYCFDAPNLEILEADVMSHKAVKTGGPTTKPARSI